PPQLFPSPSKTRVLGVKVADLNRDGRDDLLISGSSDPNTHVLLGNGDGTFRAAADIPGLAVGLIVVDLNGDGNLDVINAVKNHNTVAYMLGNGDGTFRDRKELSAGQYPLAVAVADFVTLRPDGSTVLGLPDGHPDLLVAANGLPQPTLFGPPEVRLIPGKVDSLGKFAGFGPSLRLASPTGPIGIKTGDINSDGAVDAI